MQPKLVTEMLHFLQVMAANSNNNIYIRNYFGKFGEKVELLHTNPS